MTDVVCTECRRMLRKKIRWFSSGQRYYLCLAACPEHGLMKGKIRMKKSEDGRIFAVKTVKPVDEEGAEAVYQKKRKPGSDARRRAGRRSCMGWNRIDDWFDKCQQEFSYRSRSQE